VFYSNQESFRMGWNIMILYLYYPHIQNGCLIIDKKSGKTLHYLNIETGLPDDEIFSTMVDNMGGIWISHALELAAQTLLSPSRLFMFTKEFRMPTFLVYIRQIAQFMWEQARVCLLSKRNFTTKNLQQLTLSRKRCI
jgi:hypothetical protein